MVRAHWQGLLVVGLAALFGCSEQRGGQVASTAKNAELQREFDAPRYAAPHPGDGGPAGAPAPAAETATAVTPAATPEPLLAPGPHPTSPAPIEQAKAYAGGLRDELAELTHEGRGPGKGGDKFAYLEENEFLVVKDTPLSTFSIDVDTASYSKTRAYLMEHHALPPPDSVRIEELINYFDYAYPGPTDQHPFAVHAETAECPWQPKHRLVRFGIQGKKLDDNRPLSNLVFLIDVSGSMNQSNKLPLVQRSLGLLVRQLGENDKISIVVYAGAAGLVLPATSGTEQPAILAAIENLRAGGSTNGGQGIQLAYKMAEENLIKGGTNRVILCSDGDFNVGVTSTGDLVRLATEKSKAGVYLSVLGFGIGNHNDAMLEELSNKANGNYAFIDSDAEARKVLVEQMQGTLVTIAKDVKIQVEFNPAEVAAYRLVGYENRRLADRDFNDDTKDAGDIGAGHRVTALYEVVPPGVAGDLAKPGVDPLKYQASGVGGQESEEKKLTEVAKSGELLTLKLRYQPPTGGQSTLLTFPVKDGGARFGSSSPDFQFAAAVASFGMLLRNSKFKGETTYGAVLETAAAARGEDKHGLRGEFLELVKAAQQLAGPQAGATGAAIPASSPTSAWPAPGVRIRPSSFQPAYSRPAIQYHGRWSWEHVFGLGIAAGISGSILMVLMCLGLVSLRAMWPVSFGPQKMAGKEIGW